jgi:segregation and condensation protein A
MSQTFEIKLPLFEGPFDLLLFFIERDELDIYDIPISKITNDFLDYLKHLEAMNIEVASEFILVAAKLMSIKAKMLLPRQQTDESGNEIDPREELIKHLIEYKTYKSVVGVLSSMEDERFLKEKRGNIDKELNAIATQHQAEYELQTIDLFKLMQVFQKVMKRYDEEQSKPVHVVEAYPYTIEQQKDFIKHKLTQLKNIAFTDIINEVKTKIGIIYTFLAMLELLQAGDIKLNIGEGFNNFWVENNDIINQTAIN